MGDLGETKTLSQVQECFYWPGHVDAVKLWCINCPYCAARTFAIPNQEATTIGGGGVYLPFLCTGTFAL